MNPAKIRNFENEHLGRQFPWFQNLNAFETRQIRETLVRAFGAQEVNAPVDLVTFLDDKAHVVNEVNADADSFSLLDILRRLGISPQPEIFINWYRFDQIDRMKLDDLADFFQNIWYPSADDVDIFDSTLSWIVSVTHSGTVKSLFACWDEEKLRAKQ